MLRKVVGVVMLAIGLVGMVVSVAGAVVSRQVIEEVGSGLERVLSLTADSLDTVNDTLVLTKSTMAHVNDGLTTVSETATNLSVTLEDTRPLLDQVTHVTTEEIPNSLETVQAALPDVAEAAGAIDDTLRILNAFQVDRQVFGVPINFDLGIDYDPQNPLDESVVRLGSSLDAMPEALRALESNLILADGNLQIIGENIQTIAEDLEGVNSSMGEFSPHLDDFIRLATETSDLIRQTRSNLSQQLETAQLVTTLVFVWIGLSQIVPLYLGAELVTARRNGGEEPAEAALPES